MGVIIALISIRKLKFEISHIESATIDNDILSSEMQRINAIDEEPMNPMQAAELLQTASASQPQQSNDHVSRPNTIITEELEEQSSENTDTEGSTPETALLRH